MREAGGGMWKKEKKNEKRNGKKKKKKSIWSVYIILFEYLFVYLYDYLIYDSTVYFLFFCLIRMRGRVARTVLLHERNINRIRQCYEYIY